MDQKEYNLTQEDIEFIIKGYIRKIDKYSSIINYNTQKNILLHNSSKENDKFILDLEENSIYIQECISKLIDYNDILKAFEAKEESGAQE